MIDTINRVNKEVARELNINEDLVSAINKFYWKEIKKTVQEAKHTSIWIRNVGTLAVSRTKLNRRIVQIIRQIRGLQNPTRVFKVKTREQCIEEKIELLKLLLIRRNDLAIIYKTNKDITDERYNRLHKECLDTQTTNSTGVSSSYTIKQGDQTTSSDPYEGMRSLSFQ